MPRGRRALWTAPLAAAVLIAAVALARSGGSPNASGPSAAGPGPGCGTAAPGSEAYTHVVWLWMENKSYHQVIGSPDAPYENGLARDCGLATNYHNVTHPSLPNYIAATSGLGHRGLRRFATDCDPSRRCSTGARSVFSETPSWRAYEESMPSRCDRQNSGLYAVRHTPPLYFRSLTGCRRRDVAFSRLDTDIQANRLPAFAFVTPNLCHDTHDCPVATGDRWLAGEVPRILASTAYQAGELLLVITWDEGVKGRTDRCATNRTDRGCHVPALVVSPSTPAGTRAGTLFNHYSLLRTTEDLLGLPELGKAASARSMARAFGLS